MSEHLSLSVVDAVAQVRLDRPDKRNGLTFGMLHGLREIAAGLAQDGELRAVVLSGNGPSFCAGLDFASALPDRDGLAAAFAPLEPGETNAFQEACWAWRRLPVPVIAVVHGHCLGGGLQLALGADFRFSTPDAQWSVLEGKWGLIPDMTGIHTLAEQVGKDTAKLLTMTARWFSGQEAARLGLATAAVEDPQAAAAELVEELRQRSPDAVAAAKQLFERAWPGDPVDTFAQEREVQARLLVMDSTRAAQQAAARGERPAYGPRAWQVPD